MPAGCRVDATHQDFQLPADVMTVHVTRLHAVTHPSPHHQHLEEKKFHGQ
jgi:hypothetical protein